MKKILFLSVFALGLMTSCSEDDLASAPSFDSNAIAFATQSANRAMTRSGATISTIDKFTVSAVDENSTPFFSGVEFTFNGATGVFNSSTAYYWPLSGSLNFYAISNPGSVSFDAHNAPLYAYENWNGETDLVAATVLAGDKQIPYPLVFQHVLSQVYVSAEAKDKTEQYTYKLTSVEMTTPCKGTYSFADATAGVGTWEIDKNSSKEYSFADALPLSFTETGSVNTGSTYWNILPVTDGKIKFKVGYQVFQNGKMIAEFSGANVKTCEVVNPNLISGKRYVYNFLLTRGTEDAITFTTSMVDWDGNASVTDLEPLDPALTFVTFADGSTKSFDIEGVIESSATVYLTPSEMIDNLRDATYVKVGNKVTALGTRAFAGCRKLRRIDIPSSVTKIGLQAFGDTPSLQELNIEEGLQEIEERAFAYQNGWWCGTSLKNLNLPKSLKKIGKNAFRGSIFITELYLPDGLEEIGERAFEECNNLETVSIPANCIVGSNAFTQGDQTRWNDAPTPAKTSLKTAIFRGKVRFNGNFGVFSGCKNLSTIKYYSTELPDFGTLPDNQNAWSSVTSGNGIGYNTREDGTNIFYVPVDANYTQDDIDYMQKVVFDPEYCGFTFSKTL